MVKNERDGVECRILATIQQYVDTQTCTDKEELTVLRALAASQKELISQYEQNLQLMRETISVQKRIIEKLKRK